MYGLRGPMHIVPEQVCMAWMLRKILSTGIRTRGGCRYEYLIPCRMNATHSTFMLTLHMPWMLHTHTHIAFFCWFGVRAMMFSRISRIISSCSNWMCMAWRVCKRCWLVKRVTEYCLCAHNAHAAVMNATHIRCSWLQV